MVMNSSSRSYSIPGIIMVVAGAALGILSVRFVTGNPGFAGFYWSFHPVSVPFNGNMMVTGIPEILLPWLIIGLAVIVTGAILLSKSLFTRIRAAHNDKPA